MRAARARSACSVIDRCNLTILFEPGHEDLAEFLAAERVEIVASLPCYSPDNVDRQRGDGVFDKSASRALRKLNALGYGSAGSGLALNLVYNPQGPILPPPRRSSRPTTSASSASTSASSSTGSSRSPTCRSSASARRSISKGKFDGYMQLLRGAHRDENLDARDVPHARRRSTGSGYLYDCDFNQMLGLPLRVRRQAAPRTCATCCEHDLDGDPIARAPTTATAAPPARASCGGALAADTAEHTMARACRSSFPTLNEAERIVGTLARAAARARKGGNEVIVVDGGSTDATRRRSPRRAPTACFVGAARDAPSR